MTTRSSQNTETESMSTSTQDTKTWPKQERPLNNCVAENKEKGSGRRGEGEERGEAARGEVSLVLVAAGEVGVFCWRREGEMERFRGFAVS